MHSKGKVNIGRFRRVGRKGITEVLLRLVRGDRRTSQAVLRRTQDYERG
jgi:hypothetical protein